MPVSNTWVKLSLMAGILMAIVCAAGVFLPSVYEMENVSWAAQGSGQDNVTLFMVFPALLASIYYMRKGNDKAVLVWLGILVYMVYSYFLYAFFLHFGPWFLVYVAVLGLSFFSLVGGLMDLTRNKYEEKAFIKTRGVSIYLLANGLLFAVLWLIEILPPTLSGSVPKSAVDVGLWINPVHVLDLAFILPAMFMAGYSVWKGRGLGNIFALPLVVFAVAMSAAIISMIASMYFRGVTQSFGPMPLMVINAALGIYLVVKTIKQMR